MLYDVSIDKSLFEVYPEIRLGLMMFKADVKDPDDAFWNYMDGEVLPQVRKEIEGKEWGEIPGIRGSTARTPHSIRVTAQCSPRGTIFWKASKMQSFEISLQPI